MKHARCGGGGSGAFGAKTGDVFTWITCVVAGIFVILAVTANYAFDESEAPEKRVATAPPGAPAPQGPESTQPIHNRPKAPDLPREVRDDRTVQTRRLDPGFKPEATQKLDLEAPATPAQPGEMNPESTQRLDDSIWRLEEAKRILKGVKEKN